MADLLIRDVPDEVVAELEARATRLELSRTEYLRRQLALAASGSDQPVPAESLEWLSETFADLGDPDVMRGAWE